MFSPKQKQEIADKVQRILQETHHYELPEGEIQFLLHVDGRSSWSWANIKNNGADDKEIVPFVLIKNMSTDE